MQFMTQYMHIGNISGLINIEYTEGRAEQSVHLTLGILRQS